MKRFIFLVLFLPTICWPYEKNYLTINDTIGYDQHSFYIELDGNVFDEYEGDIHVPVVHIDKKGIFFFSEDIFYELLPSEERTKVIVDMSNLCVDGGDFVYLSGSRLIHLHTLRADDFGVFFVPHDVKDVN